MKIIFLDVDGVLNHPAHWDRVQRHHDGTLVQCDERCVRRVMEVVQDTNARIVVSSSHRLRFVTTTRDRFRAYGFPPRYIIGVTPSLDRVAGNKRGHDIQAWLTKNAAPRKVDGIAILDDSTDMAHLSPWLVRTDGNVGMTDADAVALRTMLARPWPTAEVPA